ncbi:MAG: glycosyltransferase family 4 protein [Lentisphaerota bacterium]
MRDKVSEMIDTGKYDAILLFEMNTIQYCPTYSYKYIIVNIEDPQSIKIMRMASLKVWSFLQRIKLLLFGKITESYEKKILPKMAKVLLLSESDIQDFKKQYNYKNLGFVSYGIHKHPQKDILGYNERTEGMILFSGNMFHPPNVDGALFFLQQIFPLVRQKYNSAKLWIVGADPDIRIYEAAKCFGKNVVITGRVNDISEYLRISIVSICTVRLKIGVQTKILEALSWGTPVVTLSAGNSGIGAIPGQELFVEDNPKHFAARITELLRGENWNQLSDKGRTFVETQFSWEKSVEQLNKYIEQQKN